MARSASHKQFDSANEQQAGIAKFDHMMSKEEKL